jgi:hypothetical protein
MALIGVDRGINARTGQPVAGWAPVLMKPICILFEIVLTHPPK